MSLEKILGSVKKTLRSGLFYSILTSVALTGCNKSEEKTSSGLKSAKIDELMDYFPLSIGNSWEYKVTIPKDGDYYAIKNHVGKRAPIAIGRKQKQGEFLLSYNIVKEENDAFKLDVKKDELEILAKQAKMFQPLFSEKE